VAISLLYLRAIGVWPANFEIYATALAKTVCASSVIFSGEAENPQKKKLPCLPIATASISLALTPPEIYSASGESANPQGLAIIPGRKPSSVLYPFVCTRHISSESGKGCPSVRTKRNASEGVGFSSTEIFTSKGP